MYRESVELDGSQTEDKSNGGRQTQNTTELPNVHKGQLEDCGAN